MKIHWASLISVFFLLPLAGCEQELTPEMEIKHAVLYTPAGEFPFKTVLSQDSSRWKYTSAYDGKYGVIIGFWPINNGGSISIVSDQQDTKVEMRPSFYQFNSGVKETLEFRQDDKFSIHNIDFAEGWHPTHSINKDINMRYFRLKAEIITAPPQMSQYSLPGASLKIQKPDNSLQYIDEAHLEEIANEWYRYQIAFTINDEPYAIDTTFRLKISESIRVSAWGP